MDSLLTKSAALAAMLLAIQAGLAADGIVFRTAVAENADPAAAGKAAATELKAAMGDAELKAVIVVDCFEDRPLKEQALDGVAEVIDRSLLFGGASYGMFTQGGTSEWDAVALLGIGGDGIEVEAALERDMGAAGLSLEENEEELTQALGGAGAGLARQLPGVGEAALLLLFADAHSPKNQLLLDGVQSVTGPDLPITGGCVNKNAGQNWVYYQGKLYTDSAIAIALTGDFEVAQSGRQAQDNDAVIATAGESSSEALARLDAEPFAVIAFDCAGRMGKLDDPGEELAAIQEVVGTTVPLFGCYCAGEFGPADPKESADGATCRGMGWHVMVSALAGR